MLQPIIYNKCFFLVYLEILMFTFNFPPFSPFVCQTRSDTETTKHSKPGSGCGLRNIPSVESNAQTNLYYFVNIYSGL